MSLLREKQAALKKVEDELGALQSQFDAATQNKIDLENQVGAVEPRSTMSPGALA